MIITLKDGSKKEYASPMSIIDIAKDISEGLARAACVGEVDGEVCDLRTVVDKDAEVNILTFDSDARKACVQTHMFTRARRGCQESISRCQDDNWTFYR